MAKRIARKVFRWNPALEGAEAVRPAAGDVLLLCANWYGDLLFVDHVAELHGDGVLLAQIAYDLLPVVTPQIAGTPPNASPTTSKTCTRSATRFSPSRSIRSETSLPGSPRADCPSRRSTCSVSATTSPSRHRSSRRTSRFSPPTTGIPTSCFVSARSKSERTTRLLYYTYKLAHEQPIELPPIVIVGRRSWLSDDIYEVMTHDPQTKAKFVFLHDASDEELGVVVPTLPVQRLPELLRRLGPADRREPRVRRAVCRQSVRAACPRSPAR